MGAPNEQALTDRMLLNLSPELRERLRHVAQYRQMSAQAFVRQALADALRREEHRIRQEAQAINPVDAPEYLRNPNGASIDQS